MKINKDWEITNERTDLETQLLTSLDEFGITLKQPETDPAEMDFTIRRLANFKNGYVIHQKKYDGRKAYEILKVGGKMKYGNKTIDDEINMLVEDNIVKEVFYGGDEETKGYINKVAKGMPDLENSDYKNAIKFIDRVIAEQGYK